jgi:type I restriction enzyme M protein
MITRLKPYPAVEDTGVAPLREAIARGKVPLLEEGGIEEFLRREVLPHAPDAWYVPESVKTGYEISFTRYFYKPQTLRTLEEIQADILALEKETEGLLGEIIGGVKS